MRCKAWPWMAVGGLLMARLAAAQTSAPASEGPPPPTSTASAAPVEVRIVGERKQRTDRTSDNVRVSDERLRGSPKATLLETLAQHAPDMYVPARGAGIHGVGPGATGGIRLRGLGGSPTSQVVVIEDGVPDYQGLFGHPIPDAYVPFLLEEWSSTIPRSRGCCTPRWKASGCTDCS